MIAIGSPFGFENSVSAGVVSGVHRALPGGQMTPFIQTDVAVNPGNSGGPLLNSAGQVVGVNSQIYSRSGGYMGLSFAIPADVAVKVADQLKTTGKVQHGRLGVGIQGLNQSLAQSFGLPDTNGALVGSVEKDSPADKAGFKSRRRDPQDRRRRGDRQHRRHEPHRQHGAGHEAHVEVWRDGKAIELTATVGTFDDDKVAKVDDDGGAKGQARRRRAPAYRRRRRRQAATAGLVVRTPGGAAAKAGMQAGDVIVGVGTTKVTRSKN